MTPKIRTQQVSSHINSQTAHSPLMSGDGAEPAAQCRRELRNEQCFTRQKARATISQSEMWLKLSFDIHIQIALPTHKLKHSYYIGFIHIYLRMLGIKFGTYLLPFGICMTQLQGLHHVPELESAAVILNHSQVDSSFRFFPH